MTAGQKKPAADAAGSGLGVGARADPVSEVVLQGDTDHVV